MLTVDDDDVLVCGDLFAGRLACPGCGGVLRSWGLARERQVRHGIGADRRVVREHPRRGRCASCGATHVLLRVSLAARRADGAAVIAAAIEAKWAEGLGHRVIACLLDRAVSTVRGWLRAFASSAAAICRVVGGLVVRDAADAAALWPAPAPAVPGQALSMVMAYARVLSSRLGIGTVPWQGAGLATVGPWFFSASWWAHGPQHELALGPQGAVPRSLSRRQAT